MNYAGFWLRFVAAIIDGIIINTINWLVLAPIMASMGFVTSGGMFPGMGGEDFDPTQVIAMLSAMIGVAWFVKTVVDILYHSFMESSKFQGSVGKMALGLKVTDTAGAKLDFVKALIRNFCKIISGAVLFIGYIMAGFTDKKQALHDMIASTLVVKK